jgi:hypothetical protein
MTTFTVKILSFHSLYHHHHHHHFSVLPCLFWISTNFRILFIYIYIYIQRIVVEVYFYVVCMYSQLSIQWAKIEKLTIIFCSFSCLLLGTTDPLPRPSFLECL